MLKMVDGVLVDDTTVTTDAALSAPVAAQFAAIPNAISNTIGSLSATQQAAINDLSGVSTDGSLAATRYTQWNGLIPAAYGDNGNAIKWGAGTAYTTGGTVTYA